MLGLWIAASLTLLVIADSELVMVSYVSRHGVRTPYAPPAVGSVSDWNAYTPYDPPQATAWGMDEEAFAEQYLTPHGKTLIELTGAYFRNKWNNQGLFGSDDDGNTNDPCDGSQGGFTIAYADDSVRDVQTAAAFLTGFGCPSGVPVHVANGSLPEMQPVLSDHYDQPGNCSLSTEEQTKGLYGGNVDALTDAWSGLLDVVSHALDMPHAPNASQLCAVVNGAATDDEDHDDNSEETTNSSSCTFRDLKYAWTGQYFEGMFTSPLYYAQFFAEAFMLQYNGNVSDWAWGRLSITELASAYAGHVKTMWFASNYWNSRAYGSQQLAYVVAALTQAASYDAGGAVDDSAEEGLGLTQPQNKLQLLFCHDTNILYLRQMLGLSWINEGWAGLSASTGGALSFELHKQTSSDDGDDDEYFVKVVYTAASPQQQRFASVLTLENPPQTAELVIPACGQLLCPLADFQRVATAALDSTCVTVPLKSTILDLVASVAGDDDACGQFDDDSGGSGGWRDRPGWALLGVAALTSAIIGAVAVWAGIMACRSKNEPGTGQQAGWCALPCFFCCKGRDKEFGNEEALRNPLTLSSGAGFGGSRVADTSTAHLYYDQVR